MERNANHARGARCDKDAGKDTDFEVTSDFIRVFVTDDVGNQTNVITFELDEDKSGCYYVTQYLPIDNDPSDDKDLIVLSIVATDADGDTVLADVDVILKTASKRK
ncbi:hypothetical protein [Vibrio taketomensis]|uniref:hypothetical protein n=1 Tax=Vibrio taketomensis TaxID=2572923 RepID=UPI00138A27EF|nr:hypothetical protein [Vibrio taketomensis]